MSKVTITRAIVSVYDKTGLDRLALALSAAGVEIISTGNTAAAIAGAGVPVTRVEDITGFPEILGGRVKTLHPKVHAGLLADLRDPAHAEALTELGIAPFQLLISNLYPFALTVAGGAGPDECVEQIDIGGPAMIRAAAKNHANVAVVTSPAGYEGVIAAVAAGGFTLDERKRLAAQAFAHTAGYDVAVASWFASAYAPDEIASETGWPDLAADVWHRGDVLRYGENPHQRAALYRPGAAGAEAGTAAGRGSAAEIADAELLHGKPMSYNNYVDADAAWRAAQDFAAPCVAIIKHSNPCGIALGTDVADAHRKANACDPTSAFGGVIAANRVITAAAAAQIAEVFTEVIAAPGYEPSALEILTRKQNQRLLRLPAATAGRDGDRDGADRGAGRAGGAVEWRRIGGGLLMQTADTVTEPGDDPGGWKLVAGSAAAEATLADLAFAWRACRAVKSNAILLASGLATVGIGMGQVNRVDSARLAVSRAGDRAAGSVAASDAYFPFADGLEVLTEAGVRAVAEPGGSIRDAEVIAAAERAGISLYFTGIRHFWH